MSDERNSDEAANFIGVSVFIHSGLSLCLQPHRPCNAL
ncbi:hypothetical protein M084_3081 [Bacteroides fragilis str. 3988 T1]|nr:hypothetical protein M084_3081 [Bacteroides fragilis str. 3988 T1]